jgi:hypothetical protein
MVLTVITWVSQIIGEDANLKQIQDANMETTSNQNKESKPYLVKAVSLSMNLAITRQILPFTTQLLESVIILIGRLTKMQ